MADAVVTRIGEVQGGPVDPLELFLKVFSGEVLQAFKEKNIVEGKHVIRNIESGKTAQFPLLGRALAGYHTPGEDIIDAPYMNLIQFGERVINIDALLTAPAFIDSLDQLMNHYETRQMISEELGLALANSFDETVLRVISLAARSASNLTELPAGTVINAGATVVTDADVLLAAIADAAQTLDENEVPADGRWLALAPAQYYNLINDTDAINRDWDGRGSLADGVVSKLFGFQITTTNHLPDASSPTAVVPGERNTYFDPAGFADLVALAWHTSAVGTVRLKNLKTEMEHQIQRQGDFVISSYAVGHGILRPESAVEISKAP